MTAGSAPPPGPSPADPFSNGLFAAAYVPLTDVEPTEGSALLDALGRARIAAYLLPREDGRRRLFVAAGERADARTIVASALQLPRVDGTPAPSPDRRPDPLTGVDTDAAFAALVADWHVDTVAAVRDAERQLRREDAEWRARLGQPPAEEPVWLDEEHYVPPPPPPLPRLATPTIVAMAVLAVSILLLGLGGMFGLATDLTMLLGVSGVLLAVGLLVMRLRERNDDDDDGARL